MAIALLIEHRGCSLPADGLLQQSLHWLLYSLGVRYSLLFYSLCEQDARRGTLIRQHTLPTLARRLGFCVSTHRASCLFISTFFPVFLFTSQWRRHRQSELISVRRTLASVCGRMMVSKSSRAIRATGLLLPTSPLTDTERLVGDAAKNQVARNSENTVFDASVSSAESLTTPRCRLT